VKKKERHSRIPSTNCMTSFEELKLRELRGGFQVAQTSYRGCDGLASVKP